MGISIELDRQRARSAIMRHRAATKLGSRAVAFSLTQGFCEALEVTAKRDTNRYVSGWQQATNDAARSAGSAARRRVLPIVNSGHFSRYVRAMSANIDRTVEQREFRERRLASWYTAKGRRLDAFARGEMRKIEKLKTRESRQKEELEKLMTDRSAITMDTINWGKKRRVATVRLKAYGGEGRIVMLQGGRSVFELHNREPHCRIVERRYHTVRMASAAMRGLGMQRVAKKAFLAAGGSTPVVRL